MSLFQPQLTSQPVAARTVVADNTSAISAVNQATDALVGGIGQVRLSGLQEQFDEIAQARMTGGDRNNLMTRARVALNTFKADSPGLRTDADKLFASAFGTGGSGAGGVFSATPEEKGVDKAREAIAEYAATNGVSMRVAQERMAAKGAVEQLNLQADLDKYDEQNANKTTELSHQFSVNDNTLRVIDTMNKTLTEKGSISAQDIGGFKLSIRNEAFKMENQIRKNAFRDDGSLAVSQSELSRRLTEVKNWQTEMNTMIGEFATSKVSKEILADLNNEGALAFSQAFPVVSAASQVSPQLGSQVFDMVTTPDATRRAWISQNPKVAALIGDQKTYAKNLTTGISKITLVDRQKEPLNAVEAQTLGVTLNNSTDAITRYVWDEAASSPDAAAKMKQVAYWSPEVLESTFKPGFQHMMKAQGDKYNTVVDNLLSGAITAFHANYSLINNTLPSNVNITVTTDDSGRKALEVRTPDGLGDGLTTAEFRRNVNNMYKLLNKNPTYLKSIGEKVGQPDITPEAYLSMVLSTSSEVSPSVATRDVATANKPAPFTAGQETSNASTVEGVGRFAEWVKDDLSNLKEILDNVDATVFEGQPIGESFTRIKGLVNESMKGTALGDKQVAEPELQIPKVGMEMDGYRFLGGDPSKESSWESLK